MNKNNYMHGIKIPKTCLVLFMTKAVKVRKMHKN